MCIRDRINLKRVVLPDPDGPRIDVTELELILKEKSLSICFSLKK